MSAAPSYSLAAWNESAADLGHALDCLRVLTGPVCASCWDCDGEVIPAVHLATYHGYCAPEWQCEACASREPGDVGDDDGPMPLNEWTRDV